MTRRRKLALVAAGSGVALFAVGLGSAGAIATSRMLAPDEEREAVIDDAAAQLGVEPEALSDALKQALKNRVDDAVAAGKLTEEQATEFKARIDSDDYPLLLGGGFGSHGHGFGFGFGHHRGFALETAASYLGMSEAELRDALQDQTLAEIAKDEGKSVGGMVAAIVAAEEKKIDQAVADGRLTKAQATVLKSHLTDRTEALVNGELRMHRAGSRPGLWSGPGAPRGPPPWFGGPRA